MQYLVAVFLPPLYFLMKKRMVAFAVHFALFLAAILCLLTLVLAVVAFPLWLISSTCAVWDLRKQLMEEHATTIARKLAETMQHPTRADSASHTTGNHV